MPLIHMVHGFVGVGKTTFSKTLERETHAVRFSPDEWMCSLFGSNPPAEMFSEYDSRIKAVIRNISEKILAAGCDVILDEGFWTKAGRDETRSWARRTGVDVRLYALQCPENIARERALNRTKDMPQGALRIDDNALREFRALFEPVDPGTEICTVIETGEGKAFYDEQRVKFERDFYSYGDEA
ncbi:MAG TPA: ATP-binding protein [Alphaproteobacteria bacterium]|nr:ATP-binding protein [Alphaproteobacteria bacterium]